MRARRESHDNLHREPRVAYTLYVEEGLVWVRLVLVEGPVERVVARLYGDVAYERDSHIRVGFETKRDDGDDDEEHGYHSDDLLGNAKFFDNRGKIEIKVKNFMNIFSKITRPENLNYVHFSNSQFPFHRR